MFNKYDPPLSVRLSLIIMGVLAFFYILSAGQRIIVPILFALIIAILLNPLVNLLKKKLHRVVAITIALLVAFLFIAALFIFIATQINILSDSMPLLRQKLLDLIASTLQWLSEAFHLSSSQIQTWVVKVETEGLKNGPGVIGETISTISGALIIAFLIPVYTFLILFYKPLLLSFVAKLFPSDNYQAVKEVLVETKSLIQNYLIGLMLEFALLSSLYSISLFILGIQYALLLGVVGGLLNLIPYIGRIVAVCLAMTIALITKEPIFAFYVFIAYTLSKFIDNNFISPVIVASKVKINALVSIIVVLMGGTIWGVAGMFLSIPITAIAKVIFDRIDGLKPFGYLLGDTMPPVGLDLFFVRPNKEETTTN